ncbi:MAG: hypothetical protein ACOCYE_06305 [Pseudomonadota bacterium]
MVVFDSNILLLFLDNGAKPPKDPDTGAPVSECKARLDYLVADFKRNRGKVIIPTPVLSEVLVWADDAGPEYLEILTKSAHFEVVPFDIRAAVEVAHLTRQAIDKGEANVPNVSRAKVKFDRQIIAIANVVGATTIYSDDEHIVKLAKPLGIAVIGIAQLPLPPLDLQGSLFEAEPDEAEPDEAEPDDRR